MSSDPASSNQGALGRFRNSLNSSFNCLTSSPVWLCSWLCLISSSPSHFSWFARTLQSAERPQGLHLQSARLLCPISVLNLISCTLLYGSKNSRDNDDSVIMKSFLQTYEKLMKHVSWTKAMVVDFGGALITSYVFQLIKFFILSISRLNQHLYIYNIYNS